MIRRNNARRWSNGNSSFVQSWASICFALLFVNVAIAQDNLPFGMDDDPKLQLQTIVSGFTPELKAIWVSALNEDDPDVRRRACYTITLAQRRGIKGLQDAVPKLKALLGAPNERSLVRLAAAQALIALDERSTAPALMTLIDKDFFEYSLTIEPALAKWKFAGAKDLWLKRLSSDSSPIRQIMAIRGLSAFAGQDLLKPLRQVVENPKAPATVRIEAASTIGQFVDPKSALALASPFEKAGGFVNTFIAVKLLAAQKTGEAVAKLKTFAAATDLVVRAAAVDALLVSAPNWVAENATQYMLSPEPRLRISGIKALRKDTSRSALQRILNRLNDRVPDVRELARQVLDGYGTNKAVKDRILALVNQQFMDRLHWQGYEQVSLLVGNWKAKEKAMLLLPLLDDSRREANITAAWALSQLVVPETFPGVLRKAHQLTRNSPMNEDIARQLTHLIHTFGSVRFRPSLPLLRQMVRKNPMMGPTARAAGIWCLGKYYEGKQNEALCQQFLGRLDDVNSAMTEISVVRKMCAIGLGRIKTKIGQTSLDQFTDDRNKGVRAACFWSLNKRDGTKIPPAPVKIAGFDDWFIQSLQEANVDDEKSTKKKAE